MAPPERLVLPPELHRRFLCTVCARSPVKSFGYFIADADPMRPTDFVLFRANLRNHVRWKGRFEAYGRYFVDHDDAGFVADPEESWRVQQEIWARGMFEVGVFHSHRRHPANFSQVDYDLHVRRFPGLWHLVISLRNPLLPQLRAFAIVESGVRELTIDVGALLEHQSEAQK